MTDRVHPAMQPVQPPRAEEGVDGPGPRAHAQQLRASHDAVLVHRQPRRARVEGESVGWGLQVDE